MKPNGTGKGKRIKIGYLKKKKTMRTKEDERYLSTTTITTVANVFALLKLHSNQLLQNCNRLNKTKSSKPEELLPS